MNFDLKFLEGVYFAVNGEVSLRFERLHSICMSFDVSELRNEVAFNFTTEPEASSRSGSRSFLLCLHQLWPR